MLFGIQCATGNFSSPRPGIINDRLCLFASVLQLSSGLFLLRPRGGTARVGVRPGLFKDFVGGGFRLAYNVVAFDVRVGQYLLCIRTDSISLGFDADDVAVRVDERRILCFQRFNFSGFFGYSLFCVCGLFLLRRFVV